MKNTIKIKLSNIEDIKKFIDICNRFEEIDIDYIIGRYSVDAKSIMGILSTSLRRVAKIKVHKADQETINNFLGLISNYIVEDRNEN